MKVSDICYCVTGLTHADYFSVNAGFIVGKSETVIIDSGHNIEAAQTIYGYAKAVAPNNKISYVINLEGHYDHILGNSYFIKKGAKIIAHSNVKLDKKELDNLLKESNNDIKIQRRRKNKEGYLYFDGVEPFIPDIHIKEDTSLNIEGTSVKIYVAPGHTDTNLIVFEEKDKVLYVADTIYSGYLPTLAFGNKKLWEKWLETLDLIESLRPNVIVPGHGPILRGHSINEEIERHRDIIKDRLQETDKHSR